MTQLQALWPKEDRQGEKWDRFWALFRKFISPKIWIYWQVQYLQFSDGYSFEASVKMSSSFQPIHVFSAEGLHMIVEFLLVEEKVNPDTLDDLRNATPFIFAVDSQECMALLLNNGADKNWKFDEKSYLAILGVEIFMEGWLHGTTPPRPELVKIVKLLIELGVDINQPMPMLSREDTATILHCAVGAKSLELFKFLMSRPDIDIHAKDGQDMTALNWMNFSPNSNYPLEISKEMTKILLEAGADPNNQDRNSGAPLAFAVMLQDPDVVELLLEHGADVNDDNNQGITALHFAASAANRADRGTEIAEKIVRNLLMFGADFEKETKDGDPPILHAAWKGYEKVFTILVNEYQKKYGSDKSFLLKKYGKESNTCFRSAAQNRTGGLAILKFMVQDWTPEQLQEMLKVSNLHNENALHMAAIDGNIDIIKYLLELGADIGLKSNYGTALDHSIRSWSVAKVQMAEYSEQTLQKIKRLEETIFFLLEKGPHLVPDSKYNLPWVIKRYHEELIIKLRECGCDIEHADSWGWTPYEYAYAERRLESMKELPGFSSWKEPNRKLRKTQVPSRLEVKETPNIYVVSDDGLSFETTPDFVNGHGLNIRVRIS
ncbi:Ankyrin-1 [Arthrobotrys entomopaga]|nr:Ankyrin-1 [Arthrobotrys entomopaga]